MTPLIAFLIESTIMLNLLIACTFLMTSIGVWLGKMLKKDLPYGSRLSTNYVLLVASMVLPLLMVSLPEKAIFNLSPKFWTTPENVAYTATKTAMQLTQKQEASFQWLSVGSSLQLAIVVFLFLGFAFFLSRLFVHWFKLKRFIKKCNQWRSIGNLILLISSQNHSPFSFRMGRKKYVVLPEAILTNRSHTVIALAHEFQHHRQGDTTWSYFFGILQAFCFWNPTLTLLARKTEELQEFACDEALLGRQTFSAQAYGQCLLWTAAFSRHTRQLVLGTTGLAGRRAEKNDHILTRRVRFMMNKSKSDERQKKNWWLKALSVLTLTVMSGLGIAANGAIGNVTLSMDDAQALNASSSQDFPVTINESVLRQLNHYVGTARGRNFVKESFARMSEHRNVINSAISDYQLPLELMAVPVVESGYKNLQPIGGKPYYGAGIWMFLKTTAQHYGLKVNNQIDERLNVELETDAAMRYLKTAHKQFRDWELALLSYNSGFSAVKKGIQRTGSTNAWDLIRGGYENDPDYLAKVIAVVLIMKNPHLLN